MRWNMATLMKASRLAVVPAALGAESVVDAVPGAVGLPGPEVVNHDAVWGQVVWQGPLGASVAGLVEDGVDHVPAVVPGGEPARLGAGTYGSISRHLRSAWSVA